MSCKYCEGKESLKGTTFDEIDEEFKLVKDMGGWWLMSDRVQIYGVEFCPMCGSELNPNGITIQHMKLSDTHYNKLVDKYDKKTVDEVIESMKNYGKLKKYKNAYLTANKWCKKRFKDKDDGWGDVE